MGENLRFRVPVGRTNIAGMMCETELLVRMSPEGQTDDAESCDCPRCRSIHQTNNSPLAAIDVYSLPDESEVPTCMRAPSN